VLVRLGAEEVQAHVERFVLYDYFL
jgi:hypothetical protein